MPHKEKKMKGRTKKIETSLLIATILIIFCAIAVYNSKLKADAAKLQVNTVSFSGTDYEIGYQRAKFYSEELKKWKGAAKELFECPNGKALMSAYQCHESAMKSQSPNLLDEYRGMAAGAEMRLEDIIIANLGEETLYNTAGFPFNEKRISEPFFEMGCSAFAMTISDRGPIIGNTHDASFPLKPGKCEYIENLKYNDGFQLIRSRGAGLNEMGLAVGTTNAHYLGKTKIGDGKSEYLSIALLRYCPDVNSAVDYIRNYRTTDDGTHFVLADISGKAAAVEKGPNDIFHVQWADSKGNLKVAWITNAPVPGSLAGDRWNFKNYGDCYTNNPKKRYARLKNIFTDPNFKYTYESAEAVLLHHDPCSGICQHGDIYPSQAYTTRTRMMLPAEGTLLLAARVDPNQEEWRPCKVGWTAKKTIKITRHQQK